MFLLMGTFVSNSGMSRELFRAANGLSDICAVGWGSRSRQRRLPPSGLVGGDRRDVFGVAYPEMRRSVIRNPCHRRDRGRRHAGGDAAAVDRACGIRHHHRTGHRQAVHRRHHSRHPHHDHVHDHHRPDQLFAAGLPANRSADPWHERLRASGISGRRRCCSYLLADFTGCHSCRASRDGGRGVGATGAFLVGVLTDWTRTRSSPRCCSDPYRRAVFTVLIGALIFGYFLTVTQTPQGHGASHRPRLPRHPRPHGDVSGARLPDGRMP